ncbi:condensation domain-containing protein [Paenibacillus taiwanensis]|uniref:condensation domain-containing protein n=1 Tax=Paenibacillus taiwanensis TaxID=401638 RepID=UPI0004261DF0
MPIRHQINRAWTVEQFINEASSITKEALSHHAYPLERLLHHLSLERDLSRNPLFHTMFSLMPYNIERILTTNSF